jgi:hypothetical protein
MTPLQCFWKKVISGIVRRELGQTLADSIQQFEQEALKSTNAYNAARIAAQQTANTATMLAARDAQNALGLIRAQLKVLKVAKAYEDSLGGLRAAGRAPVWLKDPRKSPLVSAMRSLLARDPAEIATWGNVHQLAIAIRGEAHAKFAEAIEALRPKMVGLKKETAAELDVLRAIKDNNPSVSNEARLIAAAWSDTAEMLRQKFEQAGGRLPERKDWGLPNPVHDTIKVRSIQKDDWLAKVKTLIDRKAMVDFDTGRPLRESKLDRLLSETYDSIVSDGADGPPSSALKGQGALAGRRAHHRFIVFKNADAWIEYDQLFGAGHGVFETMMSHMHSMADDIAMLETLGPNPDATKRFILSLFDREPARMSDQAQLADGKAGAAAIASNARISSYVAGGRRSFENLWDGATGKTGTPVNLEAAHVMGEIRSGLVAAQMGSAIVSSIVDPALMMMTARYNGIPAWGVLGRAIKGMATPGFEISAAQLGLVADSVAMTLRDNDRFMGETIRSGRFARMASTVIAASGLRRWTGVLRNAFGMEFMASAANRLQTGFDDLPENFRAALQRVGIDAAGWTQIRQAVPSEPRPGAKFLTQADVRATGQGGEALAQRWQQLITTEMDYAVIDSDPVARSVMLQGTQPGTFLGESLRSVTQYKGFAVTQAMMLLGRSLSRGWDRSRLMHGALTVTAMTMLGMVAWQSKQVLGGKDPVDMDPSSAEGRRAWGAALAQGGGLGIFGDFFFQDRTRFGNSLQASILGPVVGTGEKILGDFLIKNLQRAAQGEETHFTGDALYVAAGLVPGSSLWYLRTAYQRALVDQAALLIDERAAERFQRIEREAQKSWGQSFWWEPGRVEPRRAPDLSAMAGG